MGRCLQIFSTVIMVLFFANQGWTHCEIPCGIYDDQMRIQMIAEHITTMEKSMIEIVRLQKEKPKNHNQLVRWIMNKEDHANQLQDIVAQYFLAQRIKPNAKDYNAKLEVLHKMIIFAMKGKQTVDLSHIEALRSQLKRFSELYFEKSHHGDSKKK